MRDTDLSRYIGGQGENQTEGGFLAGGKVYRGDIKSIAIVDGNLKISYDWLAVMDSLQSGWAMDPDPAHLEFSLSMQIARMQSPDENGRIIFDASFVVDQILVLYPKDYAPHGELKRLDRSKISAATTPDPNAELNARATGSSAQRQHLVASHAFEREGATIRDPPSHWKLHKWNF